MADPRCWTALELKSWLIERGIEVKVVEHVTTVHEIDGKIFLSLTEEDLRLPAVSLQKLGDIKKISVAIKELLSHQQLQHDQSFNDSALESALETASSVSTMDETVISPRKRVKRRRHYLMSKEEIIKHVESPDTNLKSLIKLIISFLYCSLALWVTAFVMVLVHDRVPDMAKYPPLPDLVLDNLPFIHWAFEACEFIGVILASIFGLIIALHKHRAVILRRFFSLMGTVFLLRCVTMLITSLSVPGNHLECKAQAFGSWNEKLKQAYHIWSHLGMSIQGVRTCGDYMFSGHTTTITMMNHFITEYTPEDWYGLHTTTWVLNLFGIFFILAGHEHYSIDVFIAFYITSRLFLFYHTYAYHHANLSFQDWRVRVWYPLGWFFESGSPGRVVNEFEIPLMNLKTSDSRTPRSSSDASFGVISVSPSLKGKNKKND